MPGEGTLGLFIPGWLFLFSILLTAILLFVMVFYVRARR